MPKSKRLTIKDIAQLSNTSISTVSNYLNGRFSRMSKYTYTRIDEVVRLVHYSPNSIAQVMVKMQNVKMIGVSVSDITNPYISEVISGISKAASIHGYGILFTNSDNQINNEFENLHFLMERGCYGLIIDPVNINADWDNLLRDQMSVFIDKIPKKEKFLAVQSNNVESVRGFMSKMKEWGYSEAFFVTWALDGKSSREQRFLGFQQAMKYPDKKHLFELDYDRNQNMDVLLKIIEKYTKTKIFFFCMNAQVLEYFLELARAVGIKYPHDYGLGTYEDFNWMSLISPAISAIEQDSAAIGSMAVEMLVDKIEHEIGDDNRILNLGTQVHYRDSFI